MFLVEIDYFLLTSELSGTCNWWPSVISEADWNFFSLCKWVDSGLTSHQLKSYEGNRSLTQFMTSLQSAFFHKLRSNDAEHFRDWLSITFGFGLYRVIDKDQRPCALKWNILMKIHTIFVNTTLRQECFLCPQRNFGRHIKIAPSVHLSVHPSVCYK